MCFSVRDRVRTRVLLLSKAEGCHGRAKAETEMEEGRKDKDEYMRSRVGTLWFVRLLQTHQLLLASLPTVHHKQFLLGCRILIKSKFSITNIQSYQSINESSINQSIN